MPEIDLPNFTSDIRKLVGEDNKLPPVQSWHPNVEGVIDIRITRDGTWYYGDEEMVRTDVVKLLSGIMRKDGDDYFLVTPTEKMKIQVEDAPFVVNMMDVEGRGESQILHFSTQFGDCFTLSESHPLKVVYNHKNEPSPYLLVRDELLALVSRPVYYQMAELLTEAEGKHETKYGLWSEGGFFVF